MSLYIVVEHPHSRSAEIEKEDNGFVHWFNSFEEAREHCKEFEIRDYSIFGECSKTKNHIV